MLRTISRFDFWKQVKTKLKSGAVLNHVNYVPLQELFKTKDFLRYNRIRFTSQRETLVKAHWESAPCSVQSAFQWSQEVFRGDVSYVEYCTQGFKDTDLTQKISAAYYWRVIVLKPMTTESVFSSSVSSSQLPRPCILLGAFEDSEIHHHTTCPASLFNFIHSFDFANTRDCVNWAGVLKSIYFKICCKQLCISVDVKHFTYWTSNKRQLR